MKNPRWLFAPAFVLLLVLVQGCSSQRLPVDPAGGKGANHLDAAIDLQPGIPTLPEARFRSWATFFPLDSGSVWTYDREFLIWGDDRPAQGASHEIVARMLGKRPLFGREYTLYEELSAPGGPGIEVLFRQDREGLYELDAFFPAGATAARRGDELVAGARAIADRAGTAGEREAWLRAGAALQTKWSHLARALGPLAGHGTSSAASGSPRTDAVLEDEIQRLAYPLRIGRSWVVRRDPVFTHTVEGIDQIRVDRQSLTGYRIRIDSELFGPDDRVVVWYGSSGFLGLEALLISEGTDEEGNVVRMYSSDIRRLTSLHVVRRPSPVFPIGIP